MTYAGVGVDYDAVDQLKRMAQRAARDTADNIRRFGFSEIETSRGESVYLMDTPYDFLLAHVEEGLGTKNLVADAMYRLTGKSYYDHIAQDTVAMIVNDMITLGALPISVAMHLAVGVSHWFDDEKRYGDLIAGWKNACMLARCVYGPGETPILKDNVVPDAIILAGSAIGIVKPKERFINGNIHDGDAIIFLESSGIHANGLTMARKIAERKDGFWRRLAHFFASERFLRQAHPMGYLTPLPDGRTYGETLLDPTHIYVGFVEDCMNAGADIHYAVNITGHGWRKLMRSPLPFAYVIERLPRQLPIFEFLQERGPIDDKEAYGNLNMGAGFALYVPETEIKKIFEVACRSEHRHNFKIMHAGYIEQSNKRKVIIAPKGLEYSGETIRIR